MVMPFMNVILRVYVAILSILNQGCAIVKIEMHALLLAEHLDALDHFLIGIQLQE